MAKGSDEKDRARDGGFWAMSPRAFVVGLLGLLALVAAAFYTERALGVNQYVQESSAREALKSLVTAQEIFRQTDKDGDGIYDFGDLEDLAAAGLIDAELATGEVHGYRFTVTPGSDGVKDREYMWWAAAEPLNNGASGERCYFTNQSGTLRFAKEALRPSAQDNSNTPDHGWVTSWH